MLSIDSIDRLVEQRVGLLKAIEAFEKGKNIVLIAPTGYGKTVLSRRLVRVARERGMASGLIHVVPYRALVRQIYLEKFKGACRSVGYQSLDDIDPENKSPYYLRELVVSTLDSFVYNLYRIPVAEMLKVVGGEYSLGHYYPVLASIYTSVVVFDEAHIYLGTDLKAEDEVERESLEFVVAALTSLAKLNVPVIVETATMHSDVIADIVRVMSASYRDLELIYVGGKGIQAQSIERRLQDLGAGSSKVKLNIVEDEEFYDEHSIKWITKLVDEELALKHARELCNNEPILIVRNTISRAIKTYRELTSVCNKATLIHSLLSNYDREWALKLAGDIIKSSGVIVSTQVIEAGVEVRARVLITDLAPIENLSQRAGRLCRGEKLGLCREDGAEVYIIRGDPEKLAEVYNGERVKAAMQLIGEELSRGEHRIDWRLLATKEQEKVSFTEILERSKPLRAIETDNALNNLYRIATSYLLSDATPKTLEKLLEGLRTSLTRTSLLVNVMVSPLKECPGNIEFVTIDASRLLGREVSRSGKCLEYDDLERPQIVFVYYSEDQDSFICRESSLNHSLRKLFSKVRDPSSFIKALVNESSIKTLQRVVGIYLKAKNRCYERGLGLML